MKKIKFYLVVSPLLFCLSSFAQVQVDHPIQLTGNGANAKLTGIQSVTNTQDATSVGSIQNGGFIYAPSTGSDNNFILTLSPAINAYQPGMVFNFISNQNVTGAATLNVNNQGTIAIKKNFNYDLGLCDIQNGQVVTVVYDGTNFQMTSTLGILPATTGAISGPVTFSSNQSGVVYSVAPVAGTATYTWTVPGDAAITAGWGTDSITVTFGTDLGNISVTTGNSCASSTSNLAVSDCNHSSITFNYTGALQTWVVPACITQITITANGASGGTGGADIDNSNEAGSGGLGAQITSPPLAVTPGHTINVLVGGAGSGSQSWGGSGGGGSYVWDASSANPLVVAGGGGGNGDAPTPNDGGAGQIDVSSLTLTTVSPTGLNASGGTGGGASSGGLSGNTSWSGGGGAGWGENGFTGTASQGNGAGGNDPANGGAGGAAGPNGATGGFGGGGGCSVAGGGGGGYNGGGGGIGGGGTGSRGGGGGGGSFCITGTPTTSAAPPGNGSVTIQY